MTKYVIHGGKPLYGTVDISGAKNNRERAELIAAAEAEEAAPVYETKHTCDVVIAGAGIGGLAAAVSLS